PPHFHVMYGEYAGLIDLNSLEMLEGDLSKRTMKLVKEWGKEHKSDLIAMWNTKEFKKLKGLE
ncbi:MAG: DUF4160 domain-containing protein, partial [Sarcina sp.]